MKWVIYKLDDKLSLNPKPITTYYLTRMNRDGHKIAEKFIIATGTRQECMDILSLISAQSVIIDRDLE